MKEQRVVAFDASTSTDSAQRGAVDVLTAAANEPNGASLLAIVKARRSRLEARLERRRVAYRELVESPPRADSAEAPGNA